MKKTITLLTIVTVIIAFSGCYYDKADLVYPTPPPCDSLNMTYTKNIQSILIANCTTCHYQGNSVDGGGYNFEAYNGIKAMAGNGKLLKAITHTGPYPMPKGSAKLSDCDIARFTNWVNHGAPQ